jgi:heptosyltransferase-2
MRILIISLAGIGDTLFATPLIHELRANFPESKIDALVLWGGARDVLEGNPHLNAVHQKNLLKSSKPDALSFLWSLRNRYDVSINTHPQSRIHYRAVARMIGAGKRISHEYDRWSVFDRVLVNRALPQDYERHSIENNLALLRFLDAGLRLSSHDYELFLSPEESKWADDFVTAQGLAGRKLLGIHVGSGGTKNLALRRWPLEFYAELIQKLNRGVPELGIVLFGGPEEAKDHERLLAGAGKGLFHPKTNNLRQAAALVKRCQMFLSVDTALMHVAAAMKVPTQVVIETPTWNKPIEPYGRKFILVKNPAVAGRNLQYYRYDGGGIRGTDEELIQLMRSVSVDSVYEALVGGMKAN